MRVTIKMDRSCACFRGPHTVKEGQVVEAIPASNQPDHEKLGLLFVDEPDCPEYCYGLMLESTDYEPDRRECNEFEGLGSLDPGDDEPDRRKG